MESRLRWTTSGNESSYGANVTPCHEPPTEWVYARINDLSLAANVTVELTNGFLTRFQPKSLAEIGPCWNGGLETVFEARKSYAVRTIQPANLVED